MADEAKPLSACPFCGWNTPTIEHEPDDEYGDVWSIRCLECGVFGPACETEAEAVAVWNDRPDVAALEARIEQQESIMLAHLRDQMDEMECLPSCDSLCHDAACPVAFPVVAWRKIREEQRELRAKNAALVEALKDTRCYANSKYFRHASKLIDDALAANEKREGA